LESIHFNASEDNLSVTTIGQLVDCEYFRMDKGHQAEGCELLVSPGKVKTLIILSGFGRIVRAKESCVEFEAGDCLLVPAGYEGVVQFADDTQYLTVTI